MALSEGILDWLADRHEGVLITLRSDRSPQSSNIGFAVQDGVALVSVTDDRAKTRNLRRDPRALLHVTGDSFWVYASIRVKADVGPVTTESGDAVGQELLQLYERVAGKPHPDSQEFFEAMVTEKRLVLRLELLSVVGQGLPD
ncbi:MAG: PPOX class F420-dependent oxidoreductase [Actinomycetota bacterium]|nr:PPOX class F420-dependent oxidoreductase [Actinomycetota bacterium]